MAAFLLMRRFVYNAPMSIDPDRHGTRVRTGPLNPENEQRAREKYADYLMNTLRDADAGARAQAARMLGDTRETRAISALAEVLHDPDPRVRLQATIALGRLGGPALHAVTQALHDPDGQVRQEAARALAQATDPDSIQALVQLLHDPSEPLRQQAAFILSKIGTPAVPAVMQALSDPDPLMRWNAARVLGQMGAGAVQAIPALERLAQSDTSVVRGTGALGGPPASVASAARQAIQRLRQSGG